MAQPENKNNNRTTCWAKWPNQIGRERREGKEAQGITVMKKEKKNKPLECPCSFFDDTCGPTLFPSSNKSNYIKKI